MAADNPVAVRPFYSLVTETLSVLCRLYKRFLFGDEHCLERIQQAVPAGESTLCSSFIS